VIINLTPAFAIKMDQVANDAQDYNDKSKKKMGFFKKIGFMIKGFKLINEAKSAKNEAENEKQVESNKNTYEDMWNNNQLSLKERKALLAFRNSEKTQTIKHENHEIIPSNATLSNNTNSTNTSNKGTTETIKDNFTIPVICHTDAEKLVQKLQEQGITAEKNIQYEITISLKNKMVQLIDENGDIRYAYVENIDLENSNPTVSLITNENKRIVLSIDEFKKAYTGIVLTPESALNPETLMNKVIGIQKSYIETEKSETQSLKDRAVRDALRWGIGGIGGGILLLIIGIIIAVYFWSQIVNAVKILAGRNSEMMAKVIDPAKYAQKVGGEPQAMVETLFALKHTQTYQFSITMANLAEAGIVVIFQATSGTIVNALAQNWVKVILGIIGIIIILCSLALIGVSTYYLIKSIKKIIASNLVLGSLDLKMENLDKWSNKGDSILDSPSNGNNITKEDNQTIQNMTTNIKNVSIT